MSMQLAPEIGPVDDNGHGLRDGDVAPVLHHECGPKTCIGAVRRMRTRIGLLSQPEPIRSIIGATRREQRNS